MVSVTEPPHDLAEGWRSLRIPPMFGPVFFEKLGEGAGARRRDDEHASWHSAERAPRWMNGLMRRSQMLSVLEPGKPDARMPERQKEDGRRLAPPCRNQFFGLFRVVLHAYPPDQFLRVDGADVRGQARCRPCDGRVTAHATLRSGVVLRHVFSFVIGTGRLFEPRPDMRNHPMVARQFVAR